MSIIKNKSYENFEAIDLLISNKLFAPVIHCAYYSSLQLVIHYVYKYGLTEDETIREINNRSSHNFYITQFCKEIKTLDKRNASLFYKYFNNFKRKRNEADYYNVEILEEDTKKAKEKAEKIKFFLTKISEDGECKDIYLI